MRLITPSFVNLIGLVFGIALLFLTTACIQTSKEFSSRAKSLVIKNVNIVDVETGKVNINQHLHIVEGKIKSISSKMPSVMSGSIEIKDAKGRFLIPGLIDMHVHAYDKSAFQLSLSHGVTHVRVMNGVPEHIKWREEQKSGDWLASSMTVSSPIVHSDGDYPMSWTADTPAEAKSLAIEAKAEGYDLIKAYGSMNAESLQALIVEAQNQGIAIAKHGPHPPKGMPWGKLNAIQSVEHVEDIYQGILNYERDENKVAEAIEKVKGLNSPVTPTLNIFWQLTKISEGKQDYLGSLPEGYISPIVAYQDKKEQVKRWLTSSEKMIEHNKKTFAFLSLITNELNMAKIPLLVGSDAGACCEIKGAVANDVSILGRGVGAGTRKGDADLQAALNAGIAAILADGTHEKITSRYFNASIYSE